MMAKKLKWNDAQLRQWVADGRMASYIAQQLGRGIDTVRRHLQAMGSFVSPANRTHCNRRHEYAVVGRTLHPDGTRHCNACFNLRSTRITRTSLLRKNRRRKQARAVAADLTCAAGHPARWNTRHDGSCRLCTKQAAATKSHLWTWEGWADQRDREFATPIYLRLAPAIREWLVRNKVQP